MSPKCHHSKNSIFELSLFVVNYTENMSSFLSHRYLLSGADVNAVDYDGRSALHVAASEGRLDVIKFLVENAGANYTLKDR